jgi:peptidoglycan/LPS O-acetylase OafA/YrhL
MQRFPGIDGLRGLAILMVTVFHLWVVARPPLPVAGLDLSLYPRFGHMGVSLFFAISGFCLFYPLARATDRERPWPSWRTFWLRRAVRILPAYWLAVGIWFAFWLHGVSPTVAANWPRHLFTHLTFTHTLWADTGISINVVLWSLATEVHFYILFPLIALAITRRPLLAVTLALAGSVVLQYIASQIPANSTAGILSCSLPARLGEFMVGMYAAQLVIRHERQPLSGWVTGIWVLGVVGLVATPWIHHVIHDPPGPWVRRYWWDCMLYAPCWGALIVLATTGRPAAVRAFSWRPLAYLGIISYSVYLYNPLLNVFGKRLYGNMPTDSLIWWIFGFSVIVAVGAAGYYIAEKPFLNWRAQLRRTLEVSSPPPALVVTRESQPESGAGTQP